MKELIKLLNEGWRVEHGFVVGDEKFVKLTNKPIVRYGEMVFPVAWIVEDENGNIEVVKSYK